MTIPSSVKRAAPGAGFAMVVLTAMNLLNYIDRYVRNELQRIDWNGPTLILVKPL